MILVTAGADEDEGEDASLCCRVELLGMVWGRDEGPSAVGEGSLSKRRIVTLDAIVREGKKLKRAGVCAKYLKMGQQGGKDQI